MRILLVSHKFPPHAVGGVEVYTRRLALELCAHHQVAVFYRHDGPGGPALVRHDPSHEGFTRYRMTCNPHRRAASVVSEFFDTFLNRRIEACFTDVVAEFQPDVIHFQHVATLSARLLRIAHQAGIPVVLTLHDYWFTCSNSQLVWPDTRVCQGKAAGMNCVRCAAAARFPSLSVGWLRPALAPLFLYRDLVVKSAALHADRYISPSRFLVDHYVAAGFPEDRFTTLENGIPLEQIRSFAWHSWDGPLRIVFLGSLAWQKGVHILADAFRRLPSGRARLDVWGDPTVFPEYGDSLRQALETPEARLMGPVANHLVGKVLADADVLVVPSLWYENSPVVIQEARAVGLPVVASGHGALAEKVRHGVDGLHFSPGDAEALAQTLKRLLDEPELLARLRQGCPSPMDMTEHVRQLEAIYLH